MIKLWAVSVIGLDCVMGVTSAHSYVFWTWAVSGEEATGIGYIKGKEYMDKINPQMKFVINVVEGPDLHAHQQSLLPAN